MRYALLRLVLALLLMAPIYADAAPPSQSVGAAMVIGAGSGTPASASLTRASNTTPYTGGTTAQAVCASTSAQCSALKFAGVGRQGGTITIREVVLAKNSTTTSGASFRIWFFSSTPTLTSIDDASSFVAPYWADRGIDMSYWDCTTVQPGSDGARLDCIPGDGSSFRDMNLDSGGNLYALLTVTGNYTAASGEQFEIDFGASIN